MGYTDEAKAPVSVRIIGVLGGLAKSKNSSKLFEFMM